ncbi:enoyl-CoA hydratase [Pelagibius sp. 7325]|uniref:enoyl-CoA hydratase n=1 Tax=Pelagibius sp. 7325 TaxID=3131994 RepID=UPI0030EBCBDC
MPSEAALTNDAPLLLREDVATEMGGIARLTLNRPRQYNALSAGLMSALQAEIDSIAADPSVRAVIVEGAGRGFCAGHDLKELRAHSGDRDFFQAIFKQCSRLMTSITALPQPVIAKVHGIATAAGCQLVATCDLAVADEAAQFGTPGVNIGLFCSTPMVALSRAVPRKQAMEMLLTGDMVDAPEAQRLGLINRAVPAAALEEETLALARKVAGKSPLTLKIGKEAFYRQVEYGLVEAYAYAAQVMTTNMLARDAEEGIDAFIEKRKPQWQGR